MNTTLWISFLQAVLSVIANHALPQSKRDNALGYVALLGAMVNAGTDLNTALKALTERVQRQDPIADEEFTALQTRSDVAHAAIQADAPSDAE
jgi:hypothetical protein